MNDLQAIRCAMMRGGSSKGAYFLDNDLPADINERKRLLQRVMGSPDIRQIDGIGGATSVTTKVAVIAVSQRPEIDIEYKFYQVQVDSDIVDDKPTCGNILSGVGAFAIERGLVNIAEGETTVRIYDINTGAVIAQTVQTPNRCLTYRGDFAIAGVPGTAAPVTMKFQHIAGGKTGSYLPTGDVVNTFDGIAVSCLDISMPVVFVKAEDVGISGYESPDELNANTTLFEQLESVREQASQAMGLGSAKGNVIPKIAAVSAPQDSNEADINIRYFTPDTAHPALAVSAGFCVATGVFIDGTILHQLNPNALTVGKHHVRIATPSGVVEVGVTFPSTDINHVEGLTTRTARLLFDGKVMV